MTLALVMEDPIYLTEPYIREANWYYQPYHIGMPAKTCEPPNEGSLIPAGKVPSYMPGKNDVLSDFAIEYGIPPEAALGGAEAMYPEYIKKMQTMKKQLMKLLRRVRTRAGATLFEYAIILFLVSIVAVLVLQGIGGKTNNMLVPVNNGFQ